MSGGSYIPKNGIGNFHLFTSRAEGLGQGPDIFRGRKRPGI